MTLELDRLAAQLPAFIERYRDGLTRRGEWLDRADRSLAAWTADPDGTRARITAAFARDPRPFALDTYEPPDGVYVAPALPPVTVVAADGSSIDPDRFAPVQCFVVNVGTVVFPYGTVDEAVMSSAATLGPQAQAQADDDGDDDGAETPHRRWGVNLRRDVAELESACSAATSCEGPAVALLDGTLLPWDLDSRQVAPEVRAELHARTVAALDSLRDAPRPVSVAAYVSGSRASDVVNSLAALDNTSSPSAASDAHLFARRLGEGQRTALFRAESARFPRVEPGFGEHTPWFFYLRVGGDVARVELPSWVGGDPDRVDLLHATLVDQCARCGGYPRALQEAHELAVINGADREMFSRVLEMEAGRLGLMPVLNGKSASKRRRAL